MKDLEIDNKKPVIWCGDLNVAHRPMDLFGAFHKDRIAGFTPEERKSFGDFLDYSNFVDTFRALNPSERKYSYWNRMNGNRNRNSGWRLDYFITSKSMM